MLVGQLLLLYPSTLGRKLGAVQTGSIQAAHFNMQSLMSRRFDLIGYNRRILTHTDIKCLEELELELHVRLAAAPCTTIVG
jgi:hypothetical protein